MSAHSGPRQRLQESESVRSGGGGVGRQLEGPMGGQEEKGGDDKSSMQQYAQGLYFVQK